NAVPAPVMTIARTGSSTSPAAASAASTASRRAVHTSASSELRVACRSRVTTATAPSLRLSIMAGSTSWLDAGVLPCTPRAEDTRCVWRPPYDAGMARTGALTMLDLVLDEGSFLSWDDAPLRSPDVDTAPGYATDLERAAQKSGVDEAVVTGEGTLRGRRVVLIACEFDFLAGSIGIAAAERIVSAIERATAERLPILASPTAGGTRMQECTVAFLQMVKISAAVAGHKTAGLPYLVYLRHPTTGGVFASWGSLGHVSVAEPGALIGFLGPRVYEALYDAPFPEGVQVSENLAERGMIDGVVVPGEVRNLTATALRVLCEDPPDDDEPTPPPGPVPEPESDTGEAPGAWDAITRSRRRDRPGARAFLDQVATVLVRLSGTGQGEDSGALLLSLARFRGRSAVVLAQDRDAEHESHPLGPSALRSARRGMRIAAELGVPLVLLIDTRGATL